MAPPTQPLPHPDAIVAIVRAVTSGLTSSFDAAASQAVPAATPAALTGQSISCGLQEINRIVRDALALMLLAPRAPLAVIKPELADPNPNNVLRSVVTRAVASTLNPELDNIHRTPNGTTTPDVINVFLDSLIPTGHSPTHSHR